MGAALARRGYGVVCGGGDGIMEAACRGCAEAGGITVGMLKFNDPAECNPYIKVAIPTSMNVASNNVIIWAASAVLAFEGRYGTLNEMALALDFGKPLMVLDKAPLLDVSKVTSDRFAHVPDAGPDDIEALLERMQGMIEGA
jgi:uncharacterized protein (TIGR00725 family)